MGTVIFQQVFNIQTIKCKLSVDFRDNQLPSSMIPRNTESNCFKFPDLLCSNAVSFTHFLSVCPKYSCTYYYFCLKSQQDEEFQINKMRR